MNPKDRVAEQGVQGRGKLIEVVLWEPRGDRMRREAGEGGHIWEGAHPVYTPGYPAQTRLDSVPHVLFIPSVSIHTVLGFILYTTMVVHELL